MTQPWICPSCQRGVAPGEKTCDHGGAAAQPVPSQPEPFMPSEPYGPWMPTQPVWISYGTDTVMPSTYLMN